MRPLHLLPILLLLAVTAVPAFGDDADAELQRMQTVLAILNAELKAQYDQLPAISDALKGNAQSIQFGTQTRGGEAVGYDDAAAIIRGAARREAALNAQFDAVLQRIREVEAQKAAIITRIYELARIVSEPRPAPTPAAPASPAE